MAKKIDQAVKIVRENAGKSRKEMICIIMTDLNMTDAGASTYYYNATKRIATEDAVAGLTETVKTETIESPKTEVSAEPTNEETVIEIKAEEPALADARKGPRFSMTTGSAEIDEFVAQIDVSSIPKFLRKK